MGIGQATTESLKQNLMCLCFFCGYVAVRVATAFLVAPVLLVLNLIVSLVLIVPTIYHGFVEIHVKSTCIGPIAKALMVLGTVPVTVPAVLPISVPGWVAISGFGGRSNIYSVFSSVLISSLQTHSRIGGRIISQSFRVMFGEYSHPHRFR